MLFSGYNPYSHHGTKPAETCDVPLERFHAAQRAGGKCLSADGRYVFTSRYGEVLQAKWDDWAREFGAWETVAGADDFPAGAVRMP